MNRYFAAPPPTTTTATTTTKTTTIAAPNPPATNAKPQSLGTVFGVLVFCAIAVLAVAAGVKYREPLARFLTRGKIAMGADMARLSELEEN